MRTGELAIVGISVGTVRFYEREGTAARVARSKRASRRVAEAPATVVRASSRANAPAKVGDVLVFEPTTELQFRHNYASQYEPLPARA